MPNIDSELLSELVKISQGHTTLVAGCGERTHPLVGIYNKSTSEFLGQFLESGQRKLLDCLNELNASVHVFPESMQAKFANINTPNDWAAWNEQ